MSSGLDRQVNLQYTRDECFSVTSPGLLINSLSILKSWPEVVLAEMLLYSLRWLKAHITFVWWLYQYWCSVSDYHWGQQVHAVSDTPSHSVNVDITLGYPAANASSTQVTLTHYHPRPEVHSTCNYHNWPSFFRFAFLLIQLHLIWLIRQSSFHTCPYPANFTSQTTSSPLPSPPTHNSLLLHHFRIQGGLHHSLCQFSPLQPSPSKQWWESDGGTSTL